jgi:hypothetical protein
VRGIAWCFWVQYGLVMVLFFLLYPALGFWSAFATATMNPFSRLPVFLMGE